MPTSNFHQLNEIMLLISLTNPSRMLDIGIGFGKYGFLAREYLELWDGRQKYDEWTRRIDGIEAHEKYLSDIQHAVYDNIYVGNVLDIIPSISDGYDLVIIIGVFEHFTYDEGCRLIKIISKKCRNILIATPKIVDLRQDHFDNPYEDHKFEWNKKDFARFNLPFFVAPHAYSLIVYLGPDAPRVRRQYFTKRAKITARKLLPTLVKPYSMVLKAAAKYGWHESDQG